MSIGAVNRMISRESVALLKPTPGRSESWVDIKRCVDEVDGLVSAFGDAHCIAPFSELQVSTDLRVFPDPGILHNSLEIQEALSFPVELQLPALVAGPNFRSLRPQVSVNAIDIIIRSGDLGSGTSLNHGFGKHKSQFTIAFFSSPFDSSCLIPGVSLFSFVLSPSPGASAVFIFSQLPHPVHIHHARLQPQIHCYHCLLSQCNLTFKSLLFLYYKVYYIFLSCSSR